MNLDETLMQNVYLIVIHLVLVSRKYLYYGRIIIACIYLYIYIL